MIFCPRKANKTRVEDDSWNIGVVVAGVVKPRCGPWGPRPPEGEHHGKGEPKIILVSVRVLGRLAAGFCHPVANLKVLTQGSMGHLQHPSKKLLNASITT